MAWVGNAEHQRPTEFLCSIVHNDVGPQTKSFQFAECGCITVGNATDYCGSSDLPPNEEHLVGEGALFMFLGNDNLTNTVTSVSSINVCGGTCQIAGTAGSTSNFVRVTGVFTRLLAPHFPDQGGGKSQFGGILYSDAGVRLY
jgi:hypothetical protein